MNNELFLNCNWHSNNHSNLIALQRIFEQNVFFMSLGRRLIVYVDWNKWFNNVTRSKYILCQKYIEKYTARL